MKRNPINDFYIIKPTIEKIILNENKSELFFDLSMSLSKVEKLMLEDNLDKKFIEALSETIVNYLSVLSLEFGVDNVYKFLESRKNWGDFHKNDFLDKHDYLMIPFYKLRVEAASYFLNKNRGMSVKPLFELAKFIVFWEEITEKVE